MDAPPKEELLEAVKGFLDELVDDLEGVRRFHARVASNAIGIVLRELELEAPALVAHHDRLAALLERDSARPDDARFLREAVEALEREVSERIRAGDADTPSWREKLLAHLRASALERLAISNPGYR